LGCWWLYSHDTSMALFISKILAFVVLAWLIQQWPTLTKTLIRSFIQVGIKAGGDAISETDLTNPGNLAAYGLSVTAVIFQHLRDYAGLAVIYNLVEILFSGFAALCVVLAYFVLAIWLFITLLEFYATTAISLILLPFCIFKWTAFLAE